MKSNKHGTKKSTLCFIYKMERKYLFIVFFWIWRILYWLFHKIRVNKTSANFEIKTIEAISLITREKEILLRSFQSDFYWNPIKPLIKCNERTFHDALQNQIATHQYFLCFSIFCLFGLLKENSTLFDRLYNLFSVKHFSSNCKFWFL